MSEFNRQQIVALLDSVGIYVDAENIGIAEGVLRLIDKFQYCRSLIQSNGLMLTETRFELARVEGQRIRVEMQNETLQAEAGKLSAQLEEASALLREVETNAAFGMRIDSFLESIGKGK